MSTVVVWQMPGQLLALVTRFQLKGWTDDEGQMSPSICALSFLVRRAHRTECASRQSTPQC
eukprot:1157518-Pelagomonas_calceolata.AAC.3